MIIKVFSTSQEHINFFDFSDRYCESSYFGSGFQCKSKDCIMSQYVCDGHNNCGDWSDENLDIRECGKQYLIISEKWFHELSIPFWNLVDFWKIYTDIEPYCRNNKKDGSHPKFGIAVISPVFLSTIFVLFHWYKTEKNMLNRMMTLPLVICQVWPQYRILRILYFGLIKKSDQWKKENEHQKKDISCLGNIY